MTFLHVAFLGGTLAVVVPIVLHLIMRQQPKHLEFPALRFIKARQSANRRQVQLRHWLLLALRCAVLALLALALARPSIVASGMLGDQEAPVAAAFVFDTNPRMQYRQQNKTRLEVAQETAQWLMPQLPSDSDVAVVDARFGSAAFSVDLGAARQRIERLDASLMTRPLAAAVESAIKLVHDSEKPRKEVYVFTDLAKAAWNADAMRDLARQLKDKVEIGLYVIDVGATNPTNFGLGELRLSGQVLSRNRPLSITCDLAHAGASGERAVELYLIDNETGKASVRHQEIFTFQPGESLRADFLVGGLVPGLHQGYLKVVGQDALPADDTRWFTVDVRPEWRILIAAPQDSQRTPAEYAYDLHRALAPYSLRVQGKAAFDCTVISTEALAQTSLESYGAVCLVDPRPLGPAVWQKLHSYVSGGGGLAVFLGRNATPIEPFNEPLAQQLLPGTLQRQWRSDAGVYLVQDDAQHPILAKIKGADGSVPWDAFPVFRHWQLGNLADGVGVILRFSNDQPAILERPVGKGRVIVLVTPVSDPANPDPWNVLPTAEGSWPFMILANEMMYYLVGSAQERLNYTAGDTAVVRLGSDHRFGTYSLTTPRGDQLRTPADEKQNAVVVTSTEEAGNYRLQAGGGIDGISLGFSANLPADISRLDRASQEDLTTVFGDAPFRLARNREEIDRSVNAGRVGRELYPYLIVLMVLLLGCEQVLSNRFYQDHDTSRQRSLAAQLVASAAGKPDVEEALVTRG